ncbi:MAG: hypothetical protein K6G49_01790 [Candidatus Saccharibacteria bacterium]|nr:hypothetical protein [Candidatus Saccharibacteria bacterium]
MAKMDKLGQLAQEKVALEAELKEAQGQLADANMERQRLECDGIMAFEDAKVVVNALTDDGKLYSDDYLILDRRYCAMEIKLAKSKQCVLRVTANSEANDVLGVAIYRSGHWTDYLKCLALPIEIEKAKQGLKQTQERLDLDFAWINDTYHFSN